MCPDEILDFYDDYTTREYYTTLMLGDVSGFTELAEKYTNSGQGGPSKLTETLNSYIGPMIQEILSHDGDVLKFSGDAFIVMWKLQDGMIMRDLAVNAMQTACVIQKHFGTYETDVGVTLRVKLAIASGQTYFSAVGDPDKVSHYIITGKPVWDVKSAESLCKGGDILVSSSSWDWANPNDYIYKILPDGIHTLILDCTTSWEHSKEQYHEYNLETNNSKLDVMSTKSFSQHEHNSSDSIKIDFEQSPLIHEYSLRPKVIKVARNHLKNELRSFMLRPVVRSIELDEPLEHLTEIRQVVIVFINIVTTTTGIKRIVSLVDTAYKLICGIVTSMQGCVNKTSLFDKDLMFLCIFGLRGDKHDFEAQIGLRCAAKLRRELSTVEKIKSVSIGVTTGMTYCGVVGHILRREYTVIGMSVNKAARLMVAYNNKVVCDRESFLHSRLDSSHFILQEAKYLKGITHAGPVYEFIEHPEIPKGKIVTNPYPILSRQVEMKIFKLMLEDITNNWNARKPRDKCENEFNILIIRGEPRIGKTRLLDEISLNIPKDIACNYISLIYFHRKIPFALILLIFSAPLNLTILNTPKMREEKLNSLLSKSRYSKFLCALNEIFNVNFEIEPVYLNLSERDKYKIVKNLIAKLVLKCFNQQWIVIIDNIDNADKDSLGLLNTIVNQDRIFFIVSLTEKNLFPSKNQRICLQKSKIIELLGLDKWFHARLACQMLNVSAIPAELEKVIQEKSMGNPGWIESYLLSLSQVGGIEIKQVPKKKFKEMGLVAPPSMMTDVELKKLLSEKSIKETSERNDAWKMYETSYGESEIVLFGTSQSLLAVGNHEISNEKITVCTLPRKSHFKDLNPEISIDVVIIKLFDSLSPLDQFLLKCASVLGETVDRNMLEKLMEGTPIRDIALTVRNLFEMKILNCAGGNLFKSRGTILFFREVTHQNTDTSIECFCTGLEISEIVADLPKYASCALLRFQVASFREATYRLLTENHKIEFHTTALKYLRRYTRRCQSCGSGTFSKLLGKKNYDSRRNSRISFDRLDEILIREMDDRKSKYNDNIFKRRNSLYVNKNIHTTPRTFADIDFTDCQCNLILMTAYSQMLDHCRGIERKDKSLTAILEFVDILLTTSNIPYARKLLVDAENIINQISKFDADELVTYLYLKGKIKTLQGQCQLLSGSIDESLKTLEDAIKILGYKYPKNNVMINFEGKILYEREKCILQCFGNYSNGIVDEDKANYNDQLAKCLIQMFEIFQIKRMPSHSRFVSIWALRAALNSSNDFQVLCTAYANLITSSNTEQYHKLVPYLESYGIQICNSRSDILELKEMKAIVHLYTSIFFSRFVRGDIDDAYSIGLIARNLARIVKSITQEIMILARIIQLLIIQSKFYEVIVLLQELRCLADADMDKSGRTWYYAFCVDLQLEAGITIISIKKCEQYYLVEGNAMIDLKDPEAEMRYFTSMWLWCIRMDEWESATIWKSRKDGITYPVNNHTVAASITALKNLEGDLICYVRRAFHILLKKPLKKALLEIEEAFNIIEHQKHTLKISLARYYLLKAYYSMIHLQKNGSRKLLNWSKKLSQKVGDQQIYNWADYLGKAWNSKSQSKPNNWRETCLKSENTESIVYYTLPLPE